jgi:hypothetical protein
LNEVNIMQGPDYLQAGQYSLANLGGAALLNSSGSLLYQPEEASSSATDAVSLGVDIFDTHRGQFAARVALPDPIVPTYVPMALDETGERIFVISSTGVTVAQLAHAPLSVASANPPQGAPGSSVTIRGSGFTAGATVSFGTVLAATTLVDSGTLQVQVPAVSAGIVRITVTNPDDTRYTYDDLFQVQ